MSKKERKPYEATEKTFSKDSLKAAENFLHSVVGITDEEREDEAMVKNYKDAILSAVRLLCCEAVGIKPNSIQYEFVGEDEPDAKSNTLMSFGRVNRVGEKDGLYGVIRIYPKMQKTNDIVAFIYTLLHEFVHVSQYRLRESGKRIPQNVNNYGPDASMFDIFKYYIDYSADFCELDANITASQILLKWLKKDEVKERLSKQELKQRRAYLKAKSAQSILNCSLGNYNKLLLYTLCSPYLLYKAIKENVYRTTLGRDFDKIDSDISWNTKIGRRSKAVADRFVGRMMKRKEVSADKRRKMVDLMVVQYVTSLGVDPRRVGVVYTHPSVHEQDVGFINAYDYEKNPKSLGYIEFDRSILAMDDPQLLSGLVEFSLDKLSTDPSFLDAIEKERKRSQMPESLPCEEM